jgi:phosphate starvation-inducible protein PhoH and related proteins
LNEEINPSCIDHTLKHTLVSVKKTKTLMEREVKEQPSKGKVKGPIKFKLQLNEEQKEAKSLILENPVTVIRGMAGSGKTLLACQIALDLLFNREAEKIIITRPTVAKEDIGFLPGDLKEKMDPWLAPIYSNLYMLYDKEKIDKLVENNVIEILPFPFMRGRTFLNSCVIVDEAQNVTNNQMEMVLGRLGVASKIMICGDISQIDLKVKKDSGLDFLNTVAARVPGVQVISLKKNHRHPIVPEILGVYTEYNDR